MILLYLPFFVTFIGCGIGVLLTITNIQMRRSLLGSFFKKSYGYATFGSLLFTLGFLIGLMNSFGAEVALYDTLHHIFLLGSIFFFALVGIYFPKEANAALGGKKK